MTYIDHLSPWGAPIRAPKQQYIPLQQPDFAQPLSKWVKTNCAFLKLSYKTFICLNLPRLWPGDVYRPSVTMGAPIRAPKRQYIPLQQPHFAQPLSKLFNEETGADNGYYSFYENIPFSNVIFYDPL